MWETRVTRLETAVFGWTEQPGGLLDAKSKTDKRLEAIELSLLQARTVIRAARWLILSAAAVLTVTGSDHLAGWLATLIRGMAGAIKG